MTKRYEDFREDDAFDENGLLRDGRKMRVPLQRARITDGTGNYSELALSRPGWRMLADATINDARGAARQEYLEYITNAWRTKPPRV